MKKKNRTAKKERPLQSEQNFRSEERLGSRRAQKKQKPIRNKQCSSETSLLLFNQLNRVSDVLKCEYTFAEGPTIKGESEKKFDQKPLKQIIKMEEHHEEEEVFEDNMEHEGSPAPLDVPPPTPGEEEEEEGEEIKVPKVPAPEPKPDPKQDPKQDPKPDPKPDPKQDPKPDPKPDPKQDPKPDPKPQEPKTEEPKPPEPKPEPPKPTGDGKGKGGSDFPLFDSAVIDELKHAEAESIKTAKAIEALREEVAEYSKKENLTEDEIKTMLKKQEQLMEKLGEFEAMTKKVGDLVGLAQVASSQLGAPEKPMVTMVDGVRGGESSRHAHPEDILPKVIVCGTGEIDQVPRIIVCEPTKAKDGKHPLYPQIHGERNASRTTFQNMQSSPGPYAPGCLPPPGIGMPGYPPGVGFPGSGGAFMPGGFPARPSGYPGGPPFQMMQGMGSLPPGMMGPPQGMMGPPQGMMPPGMAPQPGMMQQQSVMPPCLPIPLCPPASPRRHKKSKKDKKTEADGDGKKDRLAEPKDYETLLQEMDCLKGELKNVTDENECLKKKVAESDKSQGDGGGNQHDQPAGGLCRADLQRGMPMCKAEAYKAMGLPIPGIGTKQTCPGAKFAASMGWNENQGCRGELKKSTECPNMAGQEQRQHATGDSPVFTPCGCKMLQQSNAECKKSDMETVVQTMEQEVKSLQKELELVQAERRGLALQKKLLQCMADSGPSTGGGPSPMMAASRDLGCKDVETNQMSIPLQQMYQKPSENLSAVEMQLNSLREQYRKLQEDYNAKVEEVSMVRVEHESAKRDSLQLLEKCREAEARVDDLLERLRAIEMEKSKMAGSKDQMTELEQQLTLAKQRYREGQEELDEVRTTMQDQMIQLEEYRNKYLTAQQTVEEQRRQIDIMELENNRIGEQVNLEIQRVKTQFQEKLQELTPLPDMLKATQLKLQECDQLRQLAERNVEQLLNQSDELKEQNKTLEKELEDLKKSSDSQTAERSNLKYSLTSGEKKIEEIKSENLKLRATVARLEELALSNDRRLDEKMHEVLQLQTQLETLREESARQVSRTKDRCESVRRTLQGQISQLEFQLAQSRAAARTAQKDRDEIRQRMQAQITSLNENFEQAQLRIRSLQSHVNYLKSSYTNIFAPEIAPPVGPKPIDGLTT